MIPIRDTVPRRTTPFVNTMLVVANVFAFLLELVYGEAFVTSFAFIPSRFFHPAAYQESVSGNVLTIFTAMFLHGGFLHLAGNMLYLWIFGDNVEDALGNFRYLVFYLAAGVSATLLQAVLWPVSTVPNIGASGAIAGVLGAYFVLYPRARVVTLVPLFLFFPLVEVPAFLYLLFWFLMQFWMGTTSLVARAGHHGGSGGVAWWAHVGGFLAGLLLVAVLKPARRPAPRYRIE